MNSVLTHTLSLATLEFGNVHHLLLVRKKYQFLLLAERGGLLCALADLRTEFDPETNTWIVPGTSTRTYQEIRLRLELLDQDIKEMSLKIAALEKESAFVAERSVGI